MKMTQGGFSILRNALGKLTSSQVSEIDFMVNEFDKDKSISYPQAAYMLATAWHECCLLKNTDKVKTEPMERGTEIVVVNCTPSWMAQSVRHICIASTHIYTMGAAMCSSLGILIMKMRQKK